MSIPMPYRSLSSPGLTSVCRWELMNDGGTCISVILVLIFLSKPEGSGLGLALVAKIIDDHGGIIELDSRPSKTIFHVMLPMDTSASRKSKKQ